MRPSPSRVRLIATDLDGTLLRSDQTISDRTFEVLAQAQAQGVTIVAATGRGHTALPKFTHAGIIELAICANGATVVDLGSDRVIERRELQGPVVAAIFDEVQAAIHDSSFAWDSSAGFGWDPAFAPHGHILIDSYASASSVDFDERATVSKAFVANDDLGYAVLAQRVKDVISVDVEVSSAGHPFVVITAATATKRNALARLCLSRDIDASQVVAFGDSWNDLDMLSWAGVGVAMANGNDDVLQAADTVTESNDQDGVANFVASLLGL